MLPDTSVTPGHTPGRYRSHGAIHTGRGTLPPSGSAALGETLGRVKGVPESAAQVDTHSPNANPSSTNPAKD